jgi:hypothetical protein
LVVSPALLKSFPLDLEEIIVGHVDVDEDSTEKWRGSFTVLQLYKLQHLVSKDHILVVLEHNLGLQCLMVVAF